MKKLQMFILILYCLFFNINYQPLNAQSSTDTVTTDELKDLILQTRSEPIFAYGYSYGGLDQNDRIRKHVDYLIDVKYQGSRRKQEALREVIAFIDLTEGTTNMFLLPYLKDKVCGGN